MIILGHKYRDKITGFEGTATCHATYLYDADSIQLTGRVYDPGKKAEAGWFEIDRLEEA